MKKKHDLLIYVHSLLTGLTLFSFTPVEAQPLLVFGKDYVCTTDQIPEGYVISGYTTGQHSCTPGLGVFRKAILIKKPSYLETVCLGSPLPEGYIISGQWVSPPCQIQNESIINNALTIQTVNPFFNVACNYSPIPLGYVITGNTTSPFCSKDPFLGNAMTIALPFDNINVCRNSPIPIGYKIVSPAFVFQCSRQGSYDLQNGYTITRELDLKNFLNLSPSGLQLVGNAKIEGKSLRLTSATFFEKGAAWYPTKQNVQNSWETQFQFQISRMDNIHGGADGFAFVIQNNSLSALSPTAGYIGYQGIPNSLAVEFDTFLNPNQSDVSANHISVHTRGTLPNDEHEAYTLGSSGGIPFLRDGKSHKGKITYSNNLLKVYVDNFTTPAMTISLNIATLLSLTNGTAYIGFTGGTGAGFENHDITGWYFK